VTTNRAVLVQLALLLTASLAVRLLALELDGHNGDVRVTARWAEYMAEVGPWRFFDGSSSIYPALLYPLWLMGLLLDGDALHTAVKAMSIPFDLAIGVLLFAVMRRRAGDDVGLLVAGLYLLNPAAILAGPVWGQVDSAGTLPYLAALVALADRRWAVAGALGAIALLVKPQFGLVLLPILVVAVLQALRWSTPRPLLRSIAGMIGAALVVCVPLALHPIRYLDILAGTADRQPSTSLNAFNPWGLLVGFKVPDDPWVGLGTALLLAGIVGALLGLRRRPRLAVVLGVGAVLVLAFYFLPTRVHERYLYPAIAVLAPFAPAGRAELVAYMGLSAGFAGSLLYALLDTTPFNLPHPWAGWIQSDSGVWVIGIVLIASAVAWTWMLVVRRPRLPRRRPRGRGA
jgi:dolichyl-phosphate-mannose-protein mannosyltransferase